MRLRPFLLIRVGLVAASGFSIAAAAVPVMRHMAGVVVLETPERPLLPEPMQATRVDLAPILERAPFGRADLPAAVGNEPDEALPDMRLKGVFASSSGPSVAMLEVAGETDLYRLGHRVTGRLELTLIRSDHVELSDARKTITLRFDEAQVTSNEATSGDAADPQSPTLFDRFSSGLVVPARNEKPPPPETTVEYIDYWRGRIRKNPKAVLDEIGLQPTENGYVIAPKHDVGVRLAGLKSGDLVRSVNGQTVGNPDDDRRFFDQIATSGQARLEIERGGKVLTLSFPLR
ncbi:type II secretion system protein N [Sulfitobacter sp. JB4-11]|uniref:type II secretion system protein N n=1 Tax=Sulfitobacter rhodophyticola TaxID=3238304 RepID=UPI00351606D5